VDDNAAGIVVRVAVSVHKHVLHDRLRQKVWLLRAHRCLICWDVSMGTRRCSLTDYQRPHKAVINRLSIIN
uniref:Uncharacterized protein n=1 Tax=Cyclopterus lumpus TaxID=8103 RepID=A0A8C2X0A3_CYCLU